MALVTIGRTVSTSATARAAASAFFACFML